MAVATAQELKALQTRRDSSKGKLSVMREQDKELHRQIADEQENLNGILAQIAKIEEASKDFLITEHAFLRFLERVDEIDFEQLKIRVLPENVKTLIDMAGSGTYPAGTHRVVVKGRTVVSVLEAE